MKIGINLVGVSYNDGVQGRYRNYKDAIDGFLKYAIDPLKQQGHDVQFYLYTYDSVEKDNILQAYQPVAKATFVESGYGKLVGGHVVQGQCKIMSIMYINSLQELLNEDLDLVISTRYDMKFLKNPFEIYTYDFSKCNFLWREPEFMNLPIVNDTFIVFPHQMTQSLINAITHAETNPPFGVNVGLHNIYLPMVDQVGEENIQWVDDRFVGGYYSDPRTPHLNTLYRMTRHD